MTRGEPEPPPLPILTHPRAVAALAAVSLVGGLFGMATSFIYLSDGSPGNLVSGAAGFLAGAILIGAALLSLAVASLARAR